MIFQLRTDQKNGLLSSVSVEKKFVEFKLPEKRVIYATPKNSPGLQRKNPRDDVIEILMLRGMEGSPVIG